jgi:hypothetical protein
MHAHIFCLNSGRESAQSGNPYGGGQGRRGTRTIWGLFAIRAMLPNKPRGVPRVNDRRVLNGLFVCHGNLILTLRALVPLADAPVTTCHGIPRSFNAAALVERQMNRSQWLDEYARRPPIVGRHRANVSISKWLRRGSFGHYETRGVSRYCGNLRKVLALVVA